MGWLIFLRVTLSVSANAIQKRLLLNRAGVYHTWILTYLLMLIPAAVVAAATDHPVTGTFWRDIAIGGSLDAIGNLAMIAALRVTDVSVFGPLNALRPILALLFGWLFIGESPSFLGMVGVGITVVGGVLLFSDTRTGHRSTLAQVARAVSLRVIGLSLGVVGAVFLKRSASQGSAELTVAAWIVFGLVVLFAAVGLHRPAELRTLFGCLRVHKGWLGWHAITFLVMQWLTIRIFQSTLLAYSFVYFQLGMVLQVFVGRVFFHEKAFGRRLAASVVMAAGSVLVLWKG